MMVLSQGHRNNKESYGFQSRKRMGRFLRNQLIQYFHCTDEKEEEEEKLIYCHSAD